MTPPITISYGFPPVENAVGYHVYVPGPPQREITYRTWWGRKKTIVVGGTPAIPVWTVEANGNITDHGNLRVDALLAAPPA